MKLAIIIPAHNEQGRILRTLDAYYNFFNNISLDKGLLFEIIVVLNGCIDNTLDVVRDYARERAEIIIIDMIEAGKGLAVTTGFIDALKRTNDIIGFVDADGATQPPYFYDLVLGIKDYDIVIASRYMPGSKISPVRPFIKTWGRKIIYNSLVRCLFYLNLYDYQCGAKLFKRQVLEKIVSHLSVRQWAFDVELLYLASLFGFSIHEVPTVWIDQAGSKLNMMRSGMKMLSSLFIIKKQHKELGKNKSAS